jgi:hypothetical protein
MPTKEELEIGYKQALEYYYQRLLKMKEQALIDIAHLRSLGISFEERKFYLDKIKWTEKQVIKLKTLKMPPVGEWVDDFPIGHWGLNGKSKSENIYEFIIKRFDLGYLQI